MEPKHPDFCSSDSVRSSQQSNNIKRAHFSAPLKLELGGELPEVTVCYETYGELNAEASNAILIAHALSGDSHVARHSVDDLPGWWDIAVGPGKAIDTNKFFVICSNVLGGCRGTTGPNTTNPLTGRPYGADFPTITMQDMTNVQRMLVKRLGINKLHAVIGGSMGGLQVLVWATKHPEMVENAIAIATAPRLTMQALAFDVVARNAILRDPHFASGQYYDSTPPDVGLAIARMLGHITYLSPQSMEQKFEPDRLHPRDVPTEFEKRFSVGSYLAYQGDKFVERFDANTYVTLSMAIDLFNLGEDPATIAKNLAPSLCSWLVVSFTSDWLFPPEQSIQIVAALASQGKKVTYTNISSSCGHDAFLLPDEIASYGEIIRAKLSNYDSTTACTELDHQPTCPCSNKSIFITQRIDYDSIISLIPTTASVLDLGCGSGELLSRLRRQGNERLTGIELTEKAILDCVQRGLNVIQADLNQGLGMFPDANYDIVVLSHTLQAIRDVEGLMSEMLRVGRQCIVSFPNFGYYKLRKMLNDSGRAPESHGILRFKWYNSPNIRFCTIADFEDFCAERNIRIRQRLALDTEGERIIEENANLLADMAIFILSL